MPTFMPDLLPAQEIFKEYAPGIRYYKLLKSLPQIPLQVPNRPYIEELDLIVSRMYDMQNTADQLDKQGKTEQAVELYEQIVAAQFDHPRAYLRLCDLYLQQGQPRKADEVCVAYLKMVQTINELGYGNPARNELVRTFVEIASEIEFPAGAEQYYNELLRNSDSVEK